MHKNLWRLTAATAVIILVSLGHAQTPQAVRADLSGTWTLDTYLSDNPEQVAASIRSDFGSRGGDQLFGFGEGGGRYGRGGAGRRGGAPRQPENQNPDRNAEDQKRLDELTASVKYPPTTLTISENGDHVTLSNGAEPPRELTANGKREKITVGSNTIDVETRWEGPTLVLEQDLGSGRKMRSTYSIVPTTKQLIVRIAFERGPGQQGPFAVKYVYNRAAPQSQPGD